MPWGDPGCKSSIPSTSSAVERGTGILDDTDVLWIELVSTNGVDADGKSACASLL